MILKNNTNITLDKFIHKALYDKSKGYYTNKNPIGHQGDFITSPYISIMFSEMITIWLISFWEKLGCPKRINIIELGAGSGEMMNQILKTVANFKKFKSSAKFYIHEKSLYLKKIQKDKIKKYGIKWMDNLNKIPNYPSIFIANEFFDALPIKQYIKKKNYWFERFITAKNNRLSFVDIKTKLSNIEKVIKDKITFDQNFIEYSPIAFKKLSLISKIIRSQNGGILIIDYGYNSKKMFDTLQSVKNHKKNNFLENIYHSDITHMINFNYYKKKIEDMKLDLTKLTTQRKFLLKLGILQRAKIISNYVTFSKKSDIYFRLKRLIDKKEMGSLFKVLFATKKENNFKLGF
tara:strand:- start:2376 stop:3419 length:1044 start_codon:yes stop_codon:yes gene_type:complete